MTELKFQEPESPGIPPVPNPARSDIAQNGANTRAASAPTVRWRPAQAAAAPSWPLPSWPTVLGRGFLCRCPSCGKTKLFRGYLRVVDVCAVCAAPLGLARADDAPPYFTIFVVGHIVVLMMLTVERHAQYSTWVSAAIWLPITLVLALVLLRPIKGATVGLMLKLGLMKSSAGD